MENHADPSRRRGFAGISRVSSGYAQDDAEIWSVPPTSDSPLIHEPGRDYISSNSATGVLGLPWLAELRYWLNIFDNF